MPKKFTRKNLLALRKLHELNQLSEEEVELLRQAEEQFSKKKESIKLPTIPEIEARPLPEELISLPSPPSPEALRALPRIGGGVGGALIGGALGGPALAIPFAGIGGALGQAGLQTTQELAGIEPLTLEESLAEIGKAGLEQAVLEAGAAGVAAVGSKLLAPFTKTLETEVFPAMQEFARRGGLIEPAKMTDSNILDFMHGVAEGAIAGRGRFIRAQTVNKQVIKEWAEEIADNFIKVATPEEAGSILLKSIEGADEAYFSLGNQLYSKIDEVVGSSRVNTAPMREFAKKALSEQKNLPSAFRSSTGNTLLRGIEKLPETISFKEAQLHRSRLISMSSSITDPQRQIAKGIMKKLSSLYDRAIEESARGLSSEALEAWRTANKYWRTGKETFRTQFIRRLLNTDPEKVADAIIRPKAVSNIKRVKKILKPQELRILQGGFIQKMLIESTSKEGDIVGGALLGQLKKYGEPTIKEILTREQINAFRRFAEAAAVQQRTVTSPGRFAIMLAQFGAIMLTRGPISTGIILISPPALAQLLTRPSAAKWLTIGLRTPSGTKEAFSVATKILGAIEREKRRQEKAQEKLEVPLTPVVPLPTELQTPTLPPIGQSQQVPNLPNPTFAIGMRG